MGKIREQEWESTEKKWMGWQQKSIKWTLREVSERTGFQPALPAAEFGCYWSQKMGLDNGFCYEGTVKSLPEPRKLLQGPEGVEIPFQTWTKSHFLWHIGEVEGEEDACYHQKGPGVSLCKQFTWVGDGSEVNNQSMCCNCPTSKPCQWRILDQLLSCMPVLQWNGTVYGCMLL